jgi:hypothetical protein
LALFSSEHGSTKGRELGLYGLDPRLSFQGSTAFEKVIGFILMNWA